MADRKLKSVLCVMSKPLSLYSLLKCAFISWKAQRMDSRQNWPLSSAMLLLSLLCASSLFAWPFCKSVAMTTRSVWRDGSVRFVWQTGSQTAVPAESSYHHQGRLSRDEQINYRLWVSVIKAGREKKKKESSDRKMSRVRRLIINWI